MFVADLTIPILPEAGPLCYYADPPAAETIRAGSFIGSVAEGGSVNHKLVRLAPHGTGTHTECYGHIVADADATLANCFTKGFSFHGYLVEIEPERLGEDAVVTLASVKNKLADFTTLEALIIKTLPNTNSKLIKKYSGTNPAYLEAALGDWLAANHVQHLLVDLPSVDREVDGGALAFHKAFWQVGPGLVPRKTATITELIYVPEGIPPGPYTVYIAPARWGLDAAPSRVWLER